MGKQVKISREALNGHVLARGKSGSGKTTQMLSLILQVVLMRRDVVVLNWRKCLDLDTIFPKFAQIYKKNQVCVDVAGDGIRIPLFTKEKNYSGQEESATALIQRVAALLTVAGDLSNPQKKYVREAVSYVYEQELFKEEGLAAVGRFLADQKQETAHNAFGKLDMLFADGVVKDGDFFVGRPAIYEFDLNGLEYDSQTVVARFLLDYLLRNAEKGKFMERGLTIFVDECHNLDFGPGSTMATLLNESRKLGICLYLATSQVFGATRKDFSVTQQCGTLLQFQPFEEERFKIAEMIATGKTSHICEHLSRLKIGECLAVGKLETNGVVRDSPVVVSSFLEIDEPVEEEV